MISLKKIIANNIFIIRNQHGLTQQEFADKLNLDISRGHISRIELGHHIPSAEFIKAVCNSFDVSADELLSNHITINNSNNTLNFQVDNSELELILKLRELSTENIETIKTLIEAMYNTKKNND